jgi:hypothetical protein
VKDEILGAIGSITTHDNVKGPGFDSPRYLSDSAKEKMDGLLALGRRAVPIVVGHARRLYREMLEAGEMEERARSAPRPEKPGFWKRTFGKREAPPPPLPVPEVSSWDLRARIKASIYLLGRFCESGETRLQEALDLLTEFSQTRQYDVFDDSRAVLKKLGITEEDMWETALRSLPVVPRMPGDSPQELPQVLSALRDSAGFQLLDRRVSGDHFSLGATYTHGHDFFRIGEDVWTRRVRSL